MFGGNKSEKFFKNMTLLPKDLQLALSIILLSVFLDMVYVLVVGGRYRYYSYSGLAFVKCDKQVLNYSSSKCQNLQKAIGLDSSRAN